MGVDLSIRWPFVSTVLATKLAELNLMPYTVLLNGLEAASTYWGTLDAQKFQTTYKVESFFKLATAASNFWSFGLLVHELGKRYSLCNINFSWKEFGNLFRDPYWKYEHREWTIDDQLKFGAYGYAAAIGVLISLIYAVKVINRIHVSSQQKLKPQEYSEDPEKQKVIEKEVKIGWERPFNQNYALFINVAKLSLNVALAALTSSRLYFIANAAFTAYTIYQIAKRKWLVVSRTREYETTLDNTRIKKVEYIYRCFLMPFSSKNTVPPPTCTICLENKPDAYFHGEHVFHEQCLISNIVLKTDGMDIRRFTRTEQSQQGSSIIRYLCTLEISKMPSCPNCREKPFYNEFKIFVFEWLSCASTIITWKES